MIDGSINKNIFNNWNPRQEMAYCNGVRMSVELNFVNESYTYIVNIPKEDEMVCNDLDTAIEIYNEAIKRHKRHT